MHQLKPPIVLVAFSAIILFGCAVLISASIAALFATWDICSLIAGAMLLPLPTALAYTQFRGTFRYNPNSARISAISLFAAGGLALFGFAITLGELATDGAQIPWRSLLLPMLAFSGICCATAWLNLRWSRQLKSDAASADGPYVPSRTSWKEVLIAAAMITCTAAFSTYFIWSTPPQYAEHVSRDEAPFGLPADAQDVSFCQGIRGSIAFEFSIDEDSFVEWVESGIGSLESNAAHVSLKKIDDPYEIHRYYFLTEELNGPESVTITDGLFYNWSKEDRGVYAAYDRENGRAYYFAHFH